MLDSHQEIVCHHELFKHERPHVALCVRGDEGKLGQEIQATKKIGTSAMLRLLTNPDRFRDCAKKDNIKSLGFKLSPTGDKAQFIPLLLNKSFRKVILERRDLLAAYVSLREAELKGTWIHLAQNTPPAAPSDDGAQSPASAAHSESAGDSVPAKALGQSKVYLRPQGLRYFVRKRKFISYCVRAALKLTGQRAFFLDYDELFDLEKQRALLEFLGVDSAQILRSSTHKQSSRSVFEKIENAEEIAQKFPQLLT